MNKTFRAVQAFLVMLFVVAFVSLGLSPAHAALVIQPPGSWEVASTGASGAVGDVVTIELAITHVTDSYADTRFYIKTVDEARQKLSFVNVAAPAGNPTVTAEQIDWPKTEFEAGVTKKYRIQVRIDRGAVGEEIKGFYISTYTGQSIMYGVADDIKVKIVAKSSPQPTAVVTPASVSQTATVAVTPAPSPVPVPVQQVAPPRSAETDSEDVSEASTDTNRDSGESHDVSPPSDIGTLAPPAPSPQSFLSRFMIDLRDGLHELGIWFVELF